MEDYTKRKRQVFGESVPDSLPQMKDYTISRMAIQEHEADRAGRHFDIRFKLGKKALSFVTRLGLPDKPGEVRRLIRTPNHKAGYMEWEGNIPKGQYGAGKVSLYDASDILMKSEPEKMSFDVETGPHKGRYSIFKHLHDWFVIKKKELEREYADRDSFKSVGSPSAVSEKDKYVAMQKLDGANFIAKINKGGISYTSASKSVTGGLVGREDALPHLRDIKLPDKYNGTVLRGELWHPMGFNVLSGIINSKPVNSWISQQEYGKVQYAPFDIVKMPDGRSGKDIPYKERLKILEDIASQINSDYIKLPQYAIKDKEKFESSIIGNVNEEGLIYRPLEGEAPNYKVKNYYDYDLKVSDFTEGTGKFKGKGIGALKLVDAGGNYVGNVGSGLSDDLRKKFYNNPKEILDRIIRVKSMKPLIDKLRAPVYMGESDKSEPDIIKKYSSVNDIARTIISGK